MTTELRRSKLSSLISGQLPEFVREDHQTFVAFLKAYYTYLDNTSPDIKDLRDLDKTLNSFIDHFRNEVGLNLPTQINANPRFLLQHIKDQYLAKGSESSYKLLFRLLFDKEVSIDYPSKQIFRVSDGKWNQDVSIIAKVTSGHPDQVVGKLIDVITPTKIIRVQIDRRQYIEIEVERVVQIADDIYEFYVDRRFFGDVGIGDRLRYKTGDIYFTADILATTSKLKVLVPGTGFKIGQLYPIRNSKGTGSIMKITRTNTEGGILDAEFIKFGTGYTTDFTSTIYADLGQSAAGTGGSSLQIIGGNISITEATDGFTESGSINKSDYAVANAIDGTYAGDILREFGSAAGGNEFSSPYDPAVIKVTLGALAKYPGYYITNDSFLNDAIFIQDSRFYQPFSYVLKIDESLDSYKSIVKTLLHPAGMAVFGEYEIKNEFDIALTLEAMIKNLSVTIQDTQNIVDLAPNVFLTKGFTDDSVSISDPTVSLLTWKPLEDTLSAPTDSQTLLFGKGLTDTQFLSDSTTNDIGKSLLDLPILIDSAPTFAITKGLIDTPVITELPYFSVTKYINNTGSGDDITTPVDSGGFMILNPYAEAGWFLEQYVGIPINFSG